MIEQPVGQERASARRCLLCDTPATITAFPHGTSFAGHDFRYLACEDCGTRFISPLPDHATLEALYAPERYHEHFYAQADPARHEAMIDLLRRHVRPGGRVLDYGCGHGDFLIAANRAGFTVTGAEFGVAARAAAKRTGLPAINLLEEDPADQPGWDCIHFGDVLEHLTAPADVMSGLTRALAPQGIIAAQGPLEANPSLVWACARTFSALRGRRPGRFPPWHLSLTNARAQRAFFRRAGLVERSWQVWEDGWPYLRHGMLRHAIGCAAIRLARLPGLEGRIGNRFRSVWQKI